MDCETISLHFFLYSILFKQATIDVAFVHISEITRERKQYLSILYVFHLNFRASNRDLVIWFWCNNLSVFTFSVEGEAKMPDGLYGSC